MLSWLNSHKKSLKYILGIINNKNSKSAGQFLDESYLGLNNIQTPLRIFKAKKPNKTTFILFPGASPFAENHPGMISLATTVMNLGYNVFIPRIPPLKALKLTSENIDWFAKAYEEIINRNDVNKKNVAIIGISFGGSILLKATLNEKIKSNPPRSMLMYGSCFDLQSGLNFLLTGQINHNGEIHHISPNEWGLTVLFHNFIKHIDAGFDTSMVETVLSARVADKLDEVEELKLKLNKHDFKFINSVLNAQITPEIKKITEKIISSQSKSLLELSPSSFCEKINLKVFIMHGANDSMVPFTESVKLGERIPDNKLLISYLYEHKEISTNTSLLRKIIEIYKLEHFFASYFKYNAS